jgi:hypothetical protein
VLRKFKALKGRGTYISSLKMAASLGGETGGQTCPSSGCTSSMDPSRVAENPEAILVQTLMWRSESLASIRKM